MSLCAFVYPLRILFTRADDAEVSTLVSGVLSMATGQPHIEIDTPERQGMYKKKCVDGNYFAITAGVKVVSPCGETDC